MSELKELLINISEEKQTKILPENLKVGVEAFGVTGNFTSDADATAADIAKDKTAYVNGEKVVGKLEIGNYYNYKSKLVQSNSATQLVIGSSVTTEIDLSEIDMTGITSIEKLCYNYTALTKVKMPDTSNVQMFGSAFANGNALIEAPECDTSSSINWNSTFNNCLSLETIPKYDFSNVIFIDGIFKACSNLKNLGGFLNYGKAFTKAGENMYQYKLDLSVSTNITHDSLMNVINNLYDLNLTYKVSEGKKLYKQSLVLGATNKAKLTAEEIAIATNKGWNVS